MSKKQNPSDKARADILAAALPIAAFEGWSRKTLKDAAIAAGFPDGADELYFPGGPLEVIEYWAEVCDAQVTEALSKLDLDTMRIRDKVTQGVLARLEAGGDHDEAARRAMSRLTLPDALGKGPAIIWRAADTIWRGINDQSTDFNYYTKRATLSAVIGTSMTSCLADQCDEKIKARKFVDARIENVMSFEKTKFKVKKSLEKFPDPAEFLGALRYGKRRRRRR